ncbi:MAG: RHS repeat-associated core domain-containing protein, partial [Candidatus Obscuribacterales bacterium]|nr:RHS repeat-associated core domain-containing protein [Candidatus Obscuribacterales bacterium]
ADSNLSGIGVTATGVSTVVNLTSASVNATTYAQSTNSTATETIVLGPTANVNQYANNNVNELVNYAAGGQTFFQGTTSKPAKSVTVTSQSLQINAAAQPVTTFSSGLTGSNTMYVQLSQSSNGSATATLVGSAVTTGAIVSITVDNSKLTGGQITKSYTVGSGNTYTSIAASLASLINADANFPPIALSATSSGAVLTLTTKSPTYVVTTNTGATETATVGYNNLGATVISVGGKITAGDVITLTTTYSPLSGGVQAVHYTVLSTDTLTTVVSGLAAAVNANSSLTGVGLSAAVSTPAILSTAQTFSASKVLPSGTSNATVTAVDGSNNSIANNYQLGVTGSPSTSLTYDLNGNMTSDGTNTYSWDAENRLIQTNYPGSGNNSNFVYDGVGHLIKITEILAGSVLSAKLLIWQVGSPCQEQLCETRDNTGNVLAQMFMFGQSLGGTKYYYAKNHQTSVCEMTDASGNLQARYIYDPYGGSFKLNSGVDSDIQYASYYQHKPSGQLVATYRQYRTDFARWINRDPLEDQINISNLYFYASNSPVANIDPSGLWHIPWTNFCGPGYSSGHSGNPYQEDNPNYPRPGDVLRQPPRGGPLNGLDICCEQHDDCMNDAHHLPNPKDRQKARTCCDKNLAKCAASTGIGIGLGLVMGVKSYFRGPGTFTQ